jgi:DNA-binding response OmpR family regulator
MPVMDSDDRCPICNRDHRAGGLGIPPHILVVEDDPSIARLIAYNLGRDGHRLTLVGDGAVALRALRELPVDLVILDLLLPLRSGWQVLRELRRDPRLATLPVLVVSALGCDRLKRELEGSGAQHVLGKPFSVAELRETVRSLLDASFTKTQSIGDSQVTTPE